MVLDAMLPRQVLSFSTSDPAFILMAEDCKNSGDSGGLATIGMLGIDPQTRGMLRHGTEVEVRKADVQGGVVEVELVGKRRFILVGEPWEQEEKHYYASRVEWIRDEDEAISADDDSQEISDKLKDLVGDADWEANCKAAKELEPLVEQWKSLVVDGKRERQPNQIEMILKDLGPMPPAERPMDRSLWVAALINPLPALGVALEIRPAVLQAPSTAAALNAALAGIKSSISHLDGTKPLW